MEDRTSSSIVIDATAATVLDAIADVETYPEWSPEVKRATVLSEDELGWPEHVEFDIDAGVLKDVYTLAYTWDVTHDGTGTVSWELVRSGVLRGLTGSYRLTGKGPTQVVYDLAVALDLPLIVSLRRKAEQTIIDTALAGLKKRCEG